MKQARGFGEVNRYVAGIDLAGSADHYVCGPRKDDGTHDVEHFGTTTDDIARMVAWLKARNVASAAMESTSVYWIPVYDALERAGIKPVLADTRQVRMVPGRKSDVQDCQWLQRLHSCGLIRGAFRPPERFNAIRTVIREMANVTAMRTQAIQAAQKSMDQMNIRLHHAVSDITGKTGMAIIGAIADGERDPHRLAAMRDRRCAKSEAEIAAELPELPEAKRRRFVADYAVSEYDAGVLTSDRDLADYFDAAAKLAKQPKLAANWITG